jgi:hypothetical protein
VAGVLAIATAAVAADVPRVPASALESRSVRLDYAGAGAAQVLVQIDDLPLDRCRGIEMTLATSVPTQLRVYLIPRNGAARYRYVVLPAPRRETTLALPLEAFDPDPQVVKGDVPGAGAMLVIDVPGFMRRSRPNTLTLGPVRPLAVAPRVPEAQLGEPIPPARSRLDRILGGWLGKAAGGRLGMPLEGRRDPAWERLPELATGLPGSVLGFGPDDDTSFMVQHLLVFRDRGPGFAPSDLLATWGTSLAYEYLWKTERRTLTEAARGAPPLACGRGPLGESLCARIRAEIWGLLSPGDPRRALELAARDGPLSNRDEGLRAAEVLAAATALAFTRRSASDLLLAVLSLLGERAGEHRRVYELCAASRRRGLSIQQARAELDRVYFAPVHARDPENAWVHALPNSGVVMLALLYGGGDFARSVALAAACGWDADCNAATVGCLVGVMRGASELPRSFVEPLGDRLRVAIAGNEHWSMRRLAKLTEEQARRRPDGRSAPLPSAGY